LNFGDTLEENVDGFQENELSDKDDDTLDG
jgi:hypothetical protein